MSTSKIQEDQPSSGSESTTLCARPYQIELLNKALERNIIVCLGTGTGKTFISVLLIKELAHQVRKDFKKGGQRTFFIVNTVPLVSQQKKVIEQNTDLTVGGYVGEMGVDFWDDKKWQAELTSHQVVVMTAQIFVDLLGHGKLRLSQVNLIVFDECHHAKKEHPYAQVMKYFQGYCKDQLPRVLGLTASIVNGKVKPQNIEREIKNLEEVLRAACETSNDDDVSEFATKPEEIHFEVLDKGNNPLNDLIWEVMTAWQDFLDDYRSSRELLVVAKFIVKECRDAMTSLGASATCRISEKFLRKLERLPKGNIDLYDQLLLEYTATQLRYLQKVYNENVEDDMEHLSPKIERIVQLLKKYGRKQAGLCGIVFVERRNTAHILCEQLKDLSTKEKDLAFLNCDFVVGHGSLATASTSDMSWKQQEKVLRKFRKHETNLLIATSVVEEGLDVPKCNLVVRFDFPKTFQSYVQSKGRARAKDSKYVILISEQDDQGYLQMYRAIEEYLSNVCQDRPLPSEEDSHRAVDTEPLNPYQTKAGATLRMSNSIPILDKYCSKLPGDRFTALKANYEVNEVGSQAFQAIVRLPMNSPIKEEIKGDVMPSKQQAKMAAAFNTCKKLHELEELDDYLLPIEDLSDEESDVEMAEDGKPKRGTKRSKQIYPRKLPRVFENSLPKPGERYFLYGFTKTNQPRAEGKILKYGILLSTRLPEIRPFVLYADDGKVVVSIKECCVNTQILSTTDILRIEKFNAQLMSELLKVSCKGNTSKSNGYYIVPLKTSSDSLNNAEIDFDELRISRATLTDSTRKISNPSTLKNGESMIVPLHRPKERFVVEKVCTNLTPCSSFPDPSKARTYEEYFRANYQLKTVKTKQPLILVRPFSGRINFLVDRKKTKAENKAARKEIHFIPEHCSLHPFSASTLSAAAELPSILHRLTSILLVLEIRDLVAEGCSDQAFKTSREGSLPPIEATEKSESKKKGESQLKKWFSNSPSSLERAQRADSFLLLQALTTKGAGDAFDLERLEMLGDAFLKQAVSICLFCCYESKDEGKLTRQKIRQISNLNLYKVSTKKEFPTFIQNTVLDRKTWLPLCLQLQTDAAKQSTCSQVKTMEEKDQDRCSITEQIISDKAVADSIEALIGAYLVSCGFQGALHFLNFLGVKVFPDNFNPSRCFRTRTSTHYGVFEVPKCLPLSENPTDHKNMAEELKGFEKNIKYEFKDKLYLLQALTHASYQQNKLAPDCYQRLEFLGDAVLDFLVTEYLYSTNHSLSPGQLTDLRQALVNNNIFAKIAVENNYHKYLKYTSPQWFKKINDFVQQLGDDKEEGKPQVDDDPFIIMSDTDEEGIEAPKVLGDIFESVAGAVFLDSGMDVVKTWQVYHRMMSPYIDHYTKNVPCNPVRWVHEHDSEAKFSEAEIKGDKILCHLTTHWGSFTGKGANKKIAKIHAARLAKDARQ